MRAAICPMTDSAALFGYVGVQDIYVRGVALSGYLKQKIERTGGRRLLWVQRNPNRPFRVSTHAMCNNYDRIDCMFNRLVAAVDATGLAQLS